MADSHGHDDHGATFGQYMGVFGALTVLTAISFAVLMIFGHGTLLAASIIMAVAVVKASLVGYIFMHLKWDWGKLYFLIIPAFILGAMMFMVFLPDTVFSWWNDPAFALPEG